MELTQHIGLVSENDLTLSSILVTAQGLVIFWILLAAVVSYKLTSAACLGVYYIFPESINNFKRVTEALFWQLCLYFLVSSLMMACKNDKY